MTAKKVLGGKRIQLRHLPPETAIEKQKKVLVKEYLVKLKKVWKKKFSEDFPITDDFVDAVIYKTMTEPR